MDKLIITLRAARVNRGLTLKDVADKTGKSIETVGKYERDSTNIPRALMTQLLKLYRVGADHIFFGVESDFTGIMSAQGGKPKWPKWH